ncbi:DUF4232 domain-containing protein [Streptomyces sp. NPDC049555]|uniref:DUF4232 domain-containing protein n=1 Tax=Streptomyces sp. NPDC049555 TaxID=3154930 RepID=UPI003448E95A
MNSPACTNRTSPRTRTSLGGWKSSALGAAAVAALLGTMTGEASAAEGPGTANTVAACTADALTVSATTEPTDDTEARHLLITARNVGDKECALYRHPRIRLGADARTTVPVIEDSDPDPGVPVTLAPGAKAYAALLVSGGARDVYEAKSITLGLQGRTPGSTASGPIDVPLPVDTLYADDGQLVTYWTTASGFALDFIMSK